MPAVAASMSDAVSAEQSSLAYAMVLMMCLIALVPLDAEPDSDDIVLRHLARELLAGVTLNFRKNDS